MLPTPHGRRTAGEKAVERAVAPDAGLPSRVHVQHVGERGLDALLLGGGLGGGHLERATANPPELVGDSEYLVKVNGCRRGHASSLSKIISFWDWPRTPAVRVCLRAVFRGGIVGRLPAPCPPAPFAPLRPFGRAAFRPRGITVRFRPGRRRVGGCTTARTWPVRELEGYRR